MTCMKWIRPKVIALMALLFLSSSAQPDDTTSIQVGEQVKWQTVGSGGATISGGGYTCASTFGQTAVGLVTSAPYRAAQGFWLYFPPTGCCVVRTGNIDCDPGDAVDISDLTSLIDHLYISFPLLCCAAEANVDGLPGIDIGDLSALIDHLYISFSLPAPCE